MITKTEEFAVKCAADFFQVTPEEVREKVDAGSIPWVTIIELIMSVVIEIIENCPQRARLPGILAAGVSRWQRILLRRKTLEIAECCGYELYRREAGDIAETVLSVAASQTEDDVNYVINEITNPDNWLF